MPHRRNSAPRTIEDRRFASIKRRARPNQIGTALSGRIVNGQFVPRKRRRKPLIK